tara:strand:+ start:2201 stop:2326 length:126 start_codon:yes stop_codon:yes gene_type:complete
LLKNVKNIIYCNKYLKQCVGIFLVVSIREFDQEIKIKNEKI